MFIFWGKEATGVGEAHMHFIRVSGHHGREAIAILLAGVFNKMKIKPVRLVSD